MASYARCLSLFFLLAISFSLETQARDSKFFSQFSRYLTKNSKENPESISISPTQSPASAPAPAPESEVIEHGYGLYGSESYRYPPTTMDPVKTTSLVGEEKFVPAEELSKHNFDEFETSYSNSNFNGNGNGNGNGIVTEKQWMSEYVEDENSYPQYKGSGKGNGYMSDMKKGMSDTRFLENGNYYYDFNQESKDRNSYLGNNRNGNGNGNVKQGVSDTRFLENGKYYSDINAEILKNENGHFDDDNNNENFEITDKHGMSDTRFMENEKYNNNHENVGFLNNGNGYANGYNEEDHYNGNNNHEYVTEERGEYNGSAKKLPPNEYDTMEEYEKEQEYKESQNDQYVP